MSSIHQHKNVGSFKGFASVEQLRQMGSGRAAQETFPVPEAQGTKEGMKHLAGCSEGLELGHAVGWSTSLPLKCKRKFAKPFPSCHLSGSSRLPCETS